MPAKLGDLARHIGGELQGDPELLIYGAAPLRDAQCGQITLVDRVEKNHALPPVRASAVVALRGFEPEGIAAILVDNAHAAFAQLVSFFRPPRMAARRGVSPLATVSPSARLAEDVEIHPFATIGDGVEIGRGATIHSGVRVLAHAKIGPGATIFPNVVLYENTVVGAHCIIHSRACLGADSAACRQLEGPARGASTPGAADLADDVDIGAMTVIDRGVHGPTVIGEGAKIDNHVVVSHDARIGPHNLLCSQAGVASASRLGRYVVVAGQAGIAQGVQIEDGAVLGAMAGVIKGVPSGARVIGMPAISERDFWVRQAMLEKLPAMRDQLTAIQTVVNELEAAIDAASSL